MIKYITTDGGQVICYNDEANKMDQPVLLSQPSHIIKGPTTDPKELCDQWLVIRKHDKTPIILNSFYELQDYLDIYILNIKSNNPITGIYGAYWRTLGASGMPILQPIFKLDTNLAINFEKNINYLDLLKKD